MADVLPVLESRTSGCVEVRYGDAPIATADVEVEELAEDGLLFRALLTGWELRPGEPARPAMLPCEVRIAPHGVTLDLPQYFSAIPLDCHGRFLANENNGRGPIEVRGRVRGQILIVDATRQIDGRPVTVRLSAALPVVIPGEQPIEILGVIL